jgi:hypothetical protein
MRLQWCRKHIDEVAEACDLSKDAVSEVKAVAAFCDEHAAFADMPTRPIRALIRIKDDPVREKAISHVKNALNKETPTGGKCTKTLTEQEIKKIIKNAELEVLSEIRKKHEENKEKTTPIFEMTKEEIIEMAKTGKVKENGDSKLLHEDVREKKKSKTELMEKAALQFLETLPTKYLSMTNDLIRTNPEKFKTITDVICSGITLLSESSKK